MGTLRIHPLNNFAMYHRAVMLLFSSSVMSNSLRPHGLQHARLPYPLLSSRDCSHSCSLSQWHQTSILSSVIPFSTCPKSSPASGSFPVSWLFASGGQSIGPWPPHLSFGPLSVVSCGLCFANSHHIRFGGVILNPNSQWVRNMIQFSITTWFLNLNLRLPVPAEQSRSVFLGFLHFCFSFWTSSQF